VPLPSPVPLSASDIAFHYHPSRPVLDSISLAPRPGAITAIVGPNGAGKSTLLRLLLGVLSPTRGRITLDKADIASLPARVRARRMAYIPQKTSPAFGFTVRECIRMGRLASDLRDDPGPVDRALASVGLASRAQDPFDTLSAGQQQRAILARALAQLDGASNSILLADEPASALDPRQSLEALSTLKEQANSGTAVILVIHDLSLASRFCDDAIVLTDQGKIAASGPVLHTLIPSVLDPVFGVRFGTTAPSLTASLPT
jgi:iron complex transport system ATP-binding protein